MSRGNVEMTQEIYRRWDDLVRADPDDKAFDEFFDPAIEIDNSNAVFDAAVYHGLDGLREYLAFLREAWTSLRLEPEEFIPVGEDQVVVSQRIFPRSRTGVEVLARSAAVYTFRQDRIIHIKTFQSRADALEAAGLLE